MDGLTNIAYDDDKQVVMLSAVKLYSAKPRTKVIIQAFAEPQKDSSNE